MLTRHVMNDDAVQSTKYWWAALAAVLIVFGGIAAAALSWTRLQIGPGLPPGDSLLLDFGSALINPQQFAIPFEVSSVLLLAAVIGAIYVSVERKGGKG
jgi:NADH-quinone oxidoreductase subunit J